MYYLTLLMNKYSKSKKKSSQIVGFFSRSIKESTKLADFIICTQVFSLYFQAAVEPFSCLAAYSAILSSSIGLKWRINP